MAKAKAKIKVKKPVESSSPHEHEDGYVASRRNKITDAWNVLYKNDDDDDYDPELGKWEILCASHSTLVHERLKRKAISMLLHPTEWCAQCKNEKETEEAKRILDVRTCERPYDDQMKMLAKLAKGDPAKCEMFEELHGLKPDQFWD